MKVPSRFAYLLPAGVLAAGLALASDQPTLAAADGAASGWRL